MNPDTYASPSGRYTIHIDAWEARMSHWIETPELIDTQSNTRLLAFSDSNWSLNKAVWQNDSVVRLSLRKYPGNHTPAAFEVTVDCQNHTATLREQTVALDKLEEALEAWKAGRAP